MNFLNALLNSLILRAVDVCAINPIDSDFGVLRRRQCFSEIALTTVGIVVLVSSSASYSSTTEVNPPIARCNGDLKGDRDFGSVMNAAFGRESKALVNLLTTPECTETLSRRITASGGVVLFSDSKIGYLVGRVPASSILHILDLGGIDYIAGALPSWPATKPDPDAKRMIRLPVPWVETTPSSENPVFGAEDGGVAELWRHYPTADGRGIRVSGGDFGSGIDMLHPAVREALSADGARVPKVADFLVIPGDDGWVTFGDLIQSKNGQFMVGDRKWRVPAEGVYRFAILTLGVEIDSSIRSAGSKLSLQAAMLWDDKGPTVRIDTDGDGDFANNPPLRDYAINHQIYWFGRQVGRQDNRIPFGIKVDHQRKRVWVAVSGRSHGATVGTMIANKFTGGLYSGTSPAVQLVDARVLSSVWSANQVYALSRPDIDFHHESGTPGEYETDYRAVERAIAAYDKIYVSASNLPGALAISGMYASAGIIRKNLRTPPPYFPWISEGVSLGDWVDFPANGAVSSLYAPSCNLQTSQRFASPALATAPIGAPAGYYVDCSLSGTIPYGSGVVASLMSEARRQNVSFDRTRIIRAIQTSAVALPWSPESGGLRGLIDAYGAWQQLVRMAAVDGKGNAFTNFRIERTLAGQPTVVDGFVEPWMRPGEIISDSLMITRTGGKPGPRTFRLSIWQNDGTYELLEHKADLDRDRPAEIKFRAKVGPGRHIAFIRLTDEASGTVMLDIPLHTRASEMPSVSKDGVELYRATIPPGRILKQYVARPIGAQASRYTMRIPYSGYGQPNTLPGLSPMLYKPNYDELESSVDKVTRVGAAQSLNSIVTDVRNREPEVIRFSNGGYPALADYSGPPPRIPIDATVTVENIAVIIQKASADSISVRNEMAAVDGAVEFLDATFSSGYLVGSGPYASAQLDKSLPAGIQQWRIKLATVGNFGSAKALLLKCDEDGSKCNSNYALPTEFGVKGATLVVDRPTSGSWKLVIRTNQSNSGVLGYVVNEARLSNGLNNSLESWKPGQSKLVSIPANRDGVNYAAFRLAKRAGESIPDEGILLAVTPLEPNAP